MWFFIKIVFKNNPYTRGQLSTAGFLKIVCSADWVQRNKYIVKYMYIEQTRFMNHTVPNKREIDSLASSVQLPLPVSNYNRILSFYAYYNKKKNMN